MTPGRPADRAAAHRPYRIADKNGPVGISFNLLEIILVGSVAGRCLGAVVVNLRSTPLRLAFGTC